MIGVPLHECPVGLFLASGELCVRTEYFGNSGQIVAYVVRSGEFFWGGAKSAAEQAEVRVTPVGNPADLVRDATRYQYLRDRQTRAADIAAGGVFAGRVPDNLILGGEDLDRAIDAELGKPVPVVEPLEHRLAECLAECIDAPLLSGRNEGGGHELELHLGFFKPGLVEWACSLLEEAGR